MSTHTEVSQANRTIHSLMARKFFIGALGFLVVLALVLTGGAYLASAPQAEALPFDNHRSQEAWSSPHQGLVDSYALREKAPMAWSARNQALADHYALIDAANRLRAQEAWSARVQGMVDSYAAVDVTAIDAANQLRSQEAWSARCQG